MHAIETHRRFGVGAPPIASGAGDDEDPDDDPGSTLGSRDLGAPLELIIDRSTLERSSIGNVTPARRRRRWFSLAAKPGGDSLNSQNGQEKPRRGKERATDRGRGLRVSWNGINIPH